MELFDERGILWLAKSQGFLPTDPPNTDTYPFSGAESSRLRS